MLRLVVERGTERFEIVGEPGVGFHVFRYVAGRCTHDHLQDDVVMAKVCAREEWDVLASAWEPAVRIVPHNPHAARPPAL